MPCWEFVCRRGESSHVLHLSCRVLLQRHLVDWVRGVGRHLRRVHVGIQLRWGGVPARRVCMQRWLLQQRHRIACVLRLKRHVRRMRLQPRLFIVVELNHELRRCKWHMHRVRGGLQMRWEWRRGGCVHLLCGLRLDVDYIKRLCHYHVNVRGDRLWCRKPVCGWVSAACRVYMQPGLFIVVDDNHELLRYN